MVPRQRSTSPATSSGSRVSASLVKPDRSANSTVTGRRSPSAPSLGVARRLAASMAGAPEHSLLAWVRLSAGDGRAVSEEPHFGQKAKSAGQAKPQDGQAASSLLPHFGQKAKSALVSDPQPRHFILWPAASRGDTGRPGHPLPGLHPIGIRVGASLPATGPARVQQ